MSLEIPKWTLNGTSEILLVSTFFPLTQSSHAMRESINWLTLFLGHISTDVYLFTTPEAADLVQSVRGPRPIVINTTFSTPLDIAPLRGKEDAYGEMVRRHKGKSLPSLDEYASLVGKPFFLAEALRNVNSELRYKYAFWVDSSAFKTQHVFSNWPDLKRIGQVWEEGRKESGSKPEDLLFLPMNKLPHASMAVWSENFGPIRNEFSQGTSLKHCISSVFAESCCDQVPSLVVLLRQSSGGKNSFSLTMINTWHNTYLSQGKSPFSTA